MSDMAMIFSDSFSAQTAYLLSLAGCLVAFAVGASLASRNSTAMHAMEAMNQWVSLRKGLRAWMVPRSADTLLLKRPTLLGAGVAVGAAISTYVLGNVDSTVFREVLLGGGESTSSLFLAAALRWLLLAGNSACVVVGVVMIVAPRAWSLVERYCDRWYSLRKMTLPLDQMHTEVDSWVMGHPTVSGLALMIVSFGLAVSLLMRLGL